MIRRLLQRRRCRRGQHRRRRLYAWGIGYERCQCQDCGCSWWFDRLAPWKEAEIDPPFHDGEAPAGGER